MNTFNKLSACIILITTVLYACKKHDQVQSTSRQNHFIKVKVVEFGTDQPLSDVSISMRSPEYLNQSTDANGFCSFNADSFSALNVYKPAYWNFKQSQYPLAPLTVYPTSSNFDYFSYPPLHYFSCDSFEIKLFPEIFVTLHIKDTSSPVNDTCSVNFNHNGEFTQAGIVYTNWANRNISVFLRPGIDTTFQYPVFGNAINKFSIIRICDDYNYFDLFQQSIMISGNSNQTFNIIY